MNEPRVFIQYKGTDICFDFTCLCGFDAHYDGYFAYNIRCTHCGRFYAMPQTVTPTLLAEAPARAINLWPEDDERGYDDSTIHYERNDDD